MTPLCAQAQPRHHHLADPDFRIRLRKDDAWGPGRAGRRLLGLGQFEQYALVQRPVAARRAGARASSTQALSHPDGARRGIGN